MNSWEFILIFWVVLIGAGVTTLLRGIGNLLIRQPGSRIYLPHLAWATIHLFLYITTWYFFFKDQAVDYSFSKFCFLFSVYALLYLLATLTFPSAEEGPTDYKAHYFRVRKPYFAIWCILTSVPVGRMFIDSSYSLDRFASWTPALHFAVVVTGLLTTNPKVHACLPLVICSVITLQISGVFG